MLDKENRRWESLIIILVDLLVFFRIAIVHRNRSLFEVTMRYVKITGPIIIMMID